MEAADGNVYVGQRSQSPRRPAILSEGKGFLALTTGQVRCDRLLVDLFRRKSSYMRHRLASLAERSRPQHAVEIAWNWLTSRNLGCGLWQYFMERETMKKISSLSLFILVWALSPLGAQTRFTPLGSLSNGALSEAYAVTPDGSKIVGYGTTNVTQNVACLWASTNLWQTGTITALPASQDFYNNSATASLQRWG